MVWLLYRDDNYCHLWSPVAVTILYRRQQIRFNNALFEFPRSLTMLLAPLQLILGLTHSHYILSGMKLKLDH